MVYGKLKPKDCATPFTFNLKTSVTYLQSEKGRVYSGSPGYLRGSPVLIGKTETVNKATAGQATSSAPSLSIVINNNGFPLRGA